jgi:hypothetical protein
MSTMTLQEFKELYPDLYSAIEKSSFDAGVAGGSAQGQVDGFVAGAEAERLRIQDVESQLIPGHEALIAALKFDGITTGPEAAVKVLAAEKTKQATSLADFRAEHIQIAAPAPSPVVDPPGADVEAKKTPAERMESLIAEKVKADSTLSYSDAFKQVQMENRELAMELLKETRPAQA